MKPVAETMSLALQVMPPAAMNAATSVGEFGRWRTKPRWLAIAALSWPLLFWQLASRVKLRCDFWFQ